MTIRIANVTEVATAELLEFYNDYTRKPCIRFSDRKTAERRTSALLQDIGMMIYVRTTGEFRVGVKTA
jgi:hypothetical protein